MKTLRADRSRVVDGPGSQARAWSPPGIRSPRNPAMAPSRGDVRSSPMAHPAERPLPKLPRPPRGERRLQPERRPRRQTSRTPCSYLRHRPPANSPQRGPQALLDITRYSYIEWSFIRKAATASERVGCAANYGGDGERTYRFALMGRRPRGPAVRLCDGSSWAAGPRELRAASCQWGIGPGGGGYTHVGGCD